MCGGRSGGSRLTEIDGGEVHWSREKVTPKAVLITVGLGWVAMHFATGEWGFG